MIITLDTDQLTSIEKNYLMGSFIGMLYSQRKKLEMIGHGNRIVQYRRFIQLVCEQNDTTEYEMVRMIISTAKQIAINSNDEDFKAFFNV